MWDLCLTSSYSNSVPLFHTRSLMRKQPLLLYCSLHSFFCSVAVATETGQYLEASRLKNTRTIYRHYYINHTALDFTILNYTTQYHHITTILCYTIWYGTVRYCTIWYYTIRYYTILYYKVLYYTILCYTKW